MGAGQADGWWRGRCRIKNYNRALKPRIGKRTMLDNGKLKTSAGNEASPNLLMILDQILGPRTMWRYDHHPAEVKEEGTTERSNGRNI